MPKDIKALAESLRQAPKAERVTYQTILAAVERLSGLVQMMLLERQLADLSGKVEALTGAKLEPQEAPAEAPDLTQLLDNLEEFTTVRKTQKGDKREYLLHRLSADFEYENSAEGVQYTTTDDTNWTAEIGVADLKQDRSEATMKGANPVVSCWVPEDSIKDIPSGQSNTGTWGNLGQNPHKNQYVIIVKPGKYDIYQELKQ